MTSTNMPRMRRNSGIYAIYFTLIFTGFAGVSYEVIWQKYLSNLFGSQAKATALILAIFLGGLALGYYLFGQISRKRSSQSLVKICAWLEIGIGIWAVFFHDLYTFFQAIVFRPGSASSDTFEFLQNGVIAFCLMGVPTLFMGATLPLLTQALSLNFKEAAQIHSRIYAINTAGAFLGAILSGFLLIPFFGLPLSMLMMAFVNIAMGTIILFVSRIFAQSSQEVDQAPIHADHGNNSAGIDKTHTPMNLSRSLTIAFIAGFCSLTLQSIFIRLVGISAGSSEYAFSMVVGSFILMLAIGAWRARDRQIGIRQLAINQWALFASAILLYFTISYWPYIVHLVRIVFSHSTPAFYIYHIFLLMTFLGLFWFPVGLMGKTMPYLFSASRSSFEELGRRVGWLYAINTLGCVLGATVGGYALFVWFDMDRIYQICLLLVALSSILAMESRFWFYKVALTVAAGSVFMFPGWDYELFNSSLFRIKNALEDSYKGPGVFKSADRTLIFNKDGANTSVAVTKNAILNTKITKKPLSIIVNGKSDGMTTGGDLRNMRLVSHLPMLLLPKANGIKTAVIGQGTGVTVGSLTLYPEVESIKLYEISSTVAEVAPLFDEFNHAITRNPKVEWIIGDAYKSLASSPTTFDVIVSEPSNPWVVGVEKLFSLEFYAMVASRLEQDGIFAQWINAYDISNETLMMVLNTFNSAFPNTLAFWVSSGDLVLLGTKGAFNQASISNAKKRFNYDGVSKEMKEMDIRSLWYLASLEFFVDAISYKDARLHSLELPKLAYMAGFDFFSDSSAMANVFDNDLNNFRIFEKFGGKLAALLIGAENTSSETSQAEMQRALCQGKNFENLAQAMNAPRICRSAMALLYFQQPKLAPSATELQMLTLTWLNPLSQEMKTDTIDNITADQALWGLDFAKNTASGLLVYQPQRLAALLDKCGDSLKLMCHQGYFSALMANGNKQAIEEKLSDPVFSNSEFEKLKTQYTTMIEALEK